MARHPSLRNADISNRDLVKALRSVLTDEAKKDLSPELLEKTREWRSKIWQLVNETDLRLCPTDAAGSPRRKYDDRGRARMP